jgi:hypothetical protein
MFYKASFFNQNIGSWNVFRMTNMKEMSFWLKNDLSSNMCDISGTLDTQDRMSWWKDDALLKMDFMVLTLDSGYIPRSNGHIECIHSFEQNMICPGLAQHSIYQLDMYTYMQSTPYMHCNLEYPSIASQVHRNHRKSADVTLFRQ